MRPWSVCWLLALGLSCSGGSALAGETGGAGRGLQRWATVSRAPVPAGRGSALTGTLYQRCGQPDAGLVNVAADIVERHAAGQAPATQAQLTEWLRAAGAPYVWPRAWLERVDADADTLGRRLAGWLARQPARGAPRCGVATGTLRGGTRVVAVVRVNAQADLAPLPTRTRVSSWLTLRASLHADATSAHVLLLSPSGRVKRVTTSLHGRTVRSRFSLDEPGRWTVQLVANLVDGPRPVAEALVFAGVAPRLSHSAPGHAKSSVQGSTTLAALIAEARAADRLPALRASRSLEALARAHAAAMIRTGRVAHDVGDGPPDQRVADANISVQAVGENVARAPTVGRLHRALWSSPSHRANILDPQFTRLGVAVLDDGRGQLWAVELFTR